MRVENQSAYLLHLRPYRDTSAIVDMLTMDFGRVAVVARGVRKKKNPKRQLLNPFRELSIDFQGDSELKLMTHFESSKTCQVLSGNFLYSGFYLNELLIRLLPEMDSHPSIFQLYEYTVSLLAEQQEIEPILRNFEFTLLDELGYGISFIADAKTHASIKENCFYICDRDQGFVEVIADDNQQMMLTGKEILAIQQKDYSLASVRRSAKLLSRYLLGPLLGKRPLKSRELFLS